MWGWTQHTKCSFNVLVVEFSLRITIIEAAASHCSFAIGLTKVYARFFQLVTGGMGDGLKRRAMVDLWLYSPTGVVVSGFLHIRFRGQNPRSI